MTNCNMNLRKAALMIAAGVGVAVTGSAPALAKDPPLPKAIEELPDKLIRYEHLKNRPGRDGKNYDIKIVYGRASQTEINSANNRKAKKRKMIAFTRVLISPVGQNKYRKPSADRLSELFPGSFVYTSIHGAEWGFNSCKKKKWHRSREYTTYVAYSKMLCGSKGFDTGHRAKIGTQMAVDRKI